MSAVGDTSILRVKYKLIYAFYQNPVVFTTIPTFPQPVVTVMMKREREHVRSVCPDTYFKKMAHVTVCMLIVYQ